MTFKRLISCLSLVFLFGVIGCSTAPDYERDNENDPGGVNFIPNPPSGENYHIDNSGNVLLTWRDNTDFESGYRIFKSLGNIENFELIAELDENTTTFQDTSKTFAFPTNYYIISFFENTESDSIEVEIDFGELTDFKAEFNDSYENIDFSWVSNITYLDGFIISKLTDSDSEFKTQTITPAESREYSLPTPQEGFVHKFKITPYKTYNSDTTLSNSEKTITVTTEPKELELKLITPDSLEATWIDISQYEDNFQINLVDQSGTKTYTLDKNTTSFVMNNNFVEGDEVEVNLKAFNDELSSPFQQSTLFTTLPVSSIKAFQHVSNNEVKISITDPSSVRREKIIYRKDENSNFIEIGTVEKNDSLFFDTNLNKSDFYTYKVSSPFSEDSEPKSSRFTAQFNLIKRIESEPEFRFIDTDRMAHSPVNSEIAYLIRNEDEVLKLRVFDYKNERIVSDVILPIDVGITFLDFSLSGNTILVNSIFDDTVYLIEPTEGAIDSITFDQKHLMDTKFISSPNHIVSLTQNESEFVELTLTDLTTKFTQIIDSLSVPFGDATISLNKEKSKIALAYRDNASSEIVFDYYDVIGNDITLSHQRTLSNNYSIPITFTQDLDTVLVRKDQYVISMFDMNSTTNIFEEERGMYNSNFLDHTTLLPNGLIYIQDQYVSFIIDSKLSKNRIVDYISYTPSAPASGVMWNHNSNQVLDFRRSHSSSVNSFFSIYSFEAKWNEFIEY